eukprot:TRINITY_DN38399_c0_g1_i1.p1 TRINITY_DN38399_c0_g1~~TRINITY_DN38399_c0_g1_i1.p1  ORF type:complete len:744 (-),score=102.64 TRINITY_DN38399_c0_g1_i1:220-2451(-)
MLLMPSAAPPMGPRLQSPPPQSAGALRALSPARVERREAAPGAAPRRAEPLGAAAPQDDSIFGAIQDLFALERETGAAVPAPAPAGIPLQQRGRGLDPWGQYGARRRTQSPPGIRPGLYNPPVPPAYAHGRRTLPQAASGAPLTVYASPPPGQTAQPHPFPRQQAYSAMVPPGHYAQPQAPLSYLPPQLQQVQQMQIPPSYVAQQQMHHAQMPYPPQYGYGGFPGMMPGAYPFMQPHDLSRPASPGRGLVAALPRSQSAGPMIMPPGMPMARRSPSPSPTRGMTPSPFSPAVPGNVPYYGDQQPRVVEKPVYIDRVVEKVVDRPSAIPRETHDAAVATSGAFDGWLAGGLLGGEEAVPRRELSRRPSKVVGGLSREPVHVVGSSKEALVVPATTAAVPHMVHTAVPPVVARSAVPQVIPSAVPHPQVEQSTVPFRSYGPGVIPATSPGPTAYRGGVGDIGAWPSQAYQSPLQRYASRPSAAASRVASKEVPVAARKEEEDAAFTDFGAWFTEAFRTEDEAPSAAPVAVAPAVVPQWQSYGPGGRKDSLDIGAWPSGAYREDFPRDASSIGSGSVSTATAYHPLPMTTLPVAGLGAHPQVVPTYAHNGAQVPATMPPVETLPAMFQHPARVPVSSPALYADPSMATMSVPTSVPSLLPSSSVQLGTPRQRPAQHGFDIGAWPSGAYRELSPPASGVFANGSVPAGSRYLQTVQKEATPKNDDDFPYHDPFNGVGFVSQRIGKLG